jgi:hypothetical protein
MSKEFEIANREVRFFLNDLGCVQVGSFHPRKTTTGALGIDSRRLTMLSLIDNDPYFTLDRELSDSIAQAILKTGVDVDDRLVGQTPIVELFQLASAFPDFFGKYPTFGEIPSEYLDEVRHTVPVYFYSQEQKIRSIGQPELYQHEDGVLEIGIPVEIEALLCQQEFELNGKLMPYSFEIPSILGKVFLLGKPEMYQGKKAEFHGLSITVPGFPEVTLSGKHLARLCLVENTDFDFTSEESE